MSLPDQNKQGWVAELAAGTVLLFVLGVAALWGLDTWVDTRAWLVDPSWYKLETGETVSLSCQRFRPVTFSLKPAPGVTRILVVGGSTAFGFPTRPTGEAPLKRNVHGMVGMVAESLETHWPGKYELINLGINGGGIVDTERIVRRAEAWGASAMIVYDGNNEFLPVPKDFSARLWSSALYRQLSVLRPRATNSQGWTSPAAHGGDEQKAAILDLFESKLNSVVDLGETFGLKVLVSTQAVNRYGMDPNWSTSGDAEVLKQASRATIEKLESDIGHAPHSSDLLWQAGIKVEDASIAGALVQGAVDHDGLQLRASGEINAAIRRVGERDGVTLIDGAEAMAQLEHNGNLFYDWVHPTERGSRVLAEALIEGLASSGVIPYSAAPLSTPSVPLADQEGGALRASRSWLQWACVREHDPGFRLSNARRLAQSVAESSRTSVRIEAAAIMAVAAGWDSSSAEIPEEHRVRLSGLHPCLAERVSSVL